MQSHLRFLLTAITLVSLGGCGDEGTEDEMTSEADIGTAEQELATWCNPCPMGSYDGSLCRVDPPEGTTPFIWMNDFYATPAFMASCPLPGSVYDPDGCRVATAPAGTTAFIWENHLYHTPAAGNSCPLPGSMFDGFNCIVATAPAGTTPFVQSNKLYHTPVYTYYCPAGTYDDGVNCYVGTPPDGHTAFLMNGRYYYTPLCEVPAPATPFLSKKATSLDDTTAYYKAVGALTIIEAVDQERGSFGRWLSTNGFGNGETVATYYNRGDLGFGRDMHCRGTSYGKACYVTNYGTVEDGLDDLANGSALNDALAHSNPGATVAMEWHRDAGPDDNPVRFFVYSPRSYSCDRFFCGWRGGGLVDEIALDGGAPQAVPGVCMNCHGGTFDPGDFWTPARVVGAQFLPFDVESFAYHDDRPQWTQEQAFRNLNLLVKETLPVGSTSWDLIEGWYAGGSPTFKGDYIPPGWRGSTEAGDLYKTVYRPYCQMCHTAQSNAPKTFPDFVAQRGTIAYETSAASTLMPHSEVTFEAFWKSGARDRLIAVLGAGEPDVYPVAGDWDGDGIDTVGLVNHSGTELYNVRLRNTHTTGPADLQFGYGSFYAAYLPLAGDFDHDGIDTLGVMDTSPASTWNMLLRNSNTSGVVENLFSFGSGSAAWAPPLAGDWNGDGIDTIGLYDETGANFHLRNSNTSGAADLLFQYGAGTSGRIPIAGDWNGDGIDTIGLYDPVAKVFLLRNSNTAGSVDINISFNFGGRGSWPVVGDWNGDGIDTIGLYDPATGIFYLRNSNTLGWFDITLRLTP